MTDGLNEKDICIVKMITNIENKLAINSLFSEDKEVQKVIKTCVYHIILKAIAISKDPRADKRAALNLYEIAKEIVINSQLDADEDTQNRLQDLINAIIDGDDLSAQLRLYNISNKQWLDSKTVLLEEKIGTLIQDNQDIRTTLTRIEAKGTPSGIKRTRSFAMFITAGIFVMLFTIVTSVAIISMVLSTTASKDSFSMEERMRLQHQQQLYQNPNPNKEMK